MQHGSFRCDLNLSLKPKGQTQLGTRSEIKNLNSFRFIEKALAYEIDRHMDVLESGQDIVQETRLFDDKSEKTFSMRSKEEANDYRYFPCPDLLPVKVEQATIDAIEKQLPELPLAKCARYQEQYQLPYEDAVRLTSDKKVADYFEDVVSHCQAKVKTVANWVIVEVLGMLNKQELTISESPVEAKRLAELLDCIQDNTISGKIAKTVFHDMCESSLSPRDIIKEKGLGQIANSDELATLIEQIINDNPKQVAQYLSGKDKLFGFFVGQAMKQTQGKASPQILTELFNKAFDGMK